MKWKSLSSVRLFATPWNSLGQKTGVGSLSLLQANFTIQESNPRIPHCRRFFTSWATLETLGNAEGIWKFRDVLAAPGSATPVKPGCGFKTLLPQIWKTQEKSYPVGEGLGIPHTTAPPSHKAQTPNLKNFLVVIAHSGGDAELRVKSCPERRRGRGRGGRVRCPVRGQDARGPDCRSLPSTLRAGPDRSERCPRGTRASRFRSWLQGSPVSAMARPVPASPFSPSSHSETHTHHFYVSSVSLTPSYDSHDHCTSQNNRARGRRELPLSTLVSGAKPERLATSRRSPSPHLPSPVTSLIGQLPRPRPLVPEWQRGGRTLGLCKPVSAFAGNLSPRMFEFK